jgi:hypothetical protein
MGLTREQVEMWRDDLCRRYGTAAIPLCDLAHKGLQVEAMREAITALREKMKKLGPALSDVFTFYAVHGMKWPTEDNWKAEADAVDTLLEQALKMNEEGIS